MKRLEGKTAIITGGGQGIGFGVAKAFADEFSKKLVADGVDAVILTST